MHPESRQLVRYLFLRVDPTWRRLAAAERARHKRELVRAVSGVRDRALVRAYSLVGTRGDADLLLWQEAERLEALHDVQAALLATTLGSYLTVAHSFVAITRRSPYVIPSAPEPAAGNPRPPSVHAQDAPYLFVYPFVKARSWYALPRERRQALMEEHVRVGRSHPALRLNTTYSFGLDDQEFVVAFEGDDPAAFVDLVMALRESEASAFTLRDTPAFTCLQMSLWEALDALGGAPDGSATAATPDAPRAPMAWHSALPPGASARLSDGARAVALFNVAGRYFAVDDRCPHGRASLSEGVVDAATCTLTCPWHAGRFDLATGAPVGGPVRAPIAVHPVTIDGDHIVVG